MTVIVVEIVIRIMMIVYVFIGFSCGRYFFEYLECMNL